MKKQAPVGIISQRERAVAEAVKESEHAHQQQWAPLSERIRALRAEREELQDLRCTLPLNERSARLDAIDAELPRLANQAHLARNEAHKRAVAAIEAQASLANAQRSAFLLGLEIERKEGDLRRLLKSEIHPRSVQIFQAQLERELEALRTEYVAFTGEGPIPAEAA